MSSPNPTGLGRPARAAGVLLLGIAVIALALGLITVFGGNGNADNSTPTSSVPTTGTQPPPTSGPTSQVPPPTKSTSGSVPPGSTSGSVPPPGSTSQAPPPPASTGPGGPGATGGAPATRSQPIRVYNNSTIHGLAQQAADDFRHDGWNVVETGNYSQGIIATATVYYRPGTDEEAAARELGQTFGLRVEPRFAGIQAARPGVIVIVTNDYTGHPGKS